MFSMKPASESYTSIIIDRMDHSWSVDSECENTYARSTLNKIKYKVGMTYPLV